LGAHRYRQLFRILETVEGYPSQRGN
jgi:hypothetical protein